MEDTTCAQNTIELCNEKNAQVSVRVTAALENGKLTISGIDCGNAPEEIWGDDDYEYWYDFDEQNTKRLLESINAAADNPLKVIKDQFGGMDGCSRLREFCDSNGIIYRFSSWI